MAKRRIAAEAAGATAAESPSGDTLIVDETSAPIFETEALMPADEMDRFKDYIVNEIATEEDSDSRKALLEKVRKWRRQRIARPENETKDEPFPKSTNLAPPLTMSKVNTIFGKTLAGFSLKRPFWATETNNPMLKREAEAFGRLLNAYANDPFSLNLKPTLRKMLYEAVSNGFQFYETIWAHDTVAIDNEDGSQSEAVLRSGPAIKLYKVEDFITNQTWTDFQKAPWLALKFELTWGEILNLQSIGRYNPDAVAAIKAFRKTDVTEAESESQNLVGVDAAPADSDDINATYDLYRFYAKWLIADRVVDLVGVMHRESGQILFLETNKIGWRLVGKIGYFSMPDSIYDIGVCHQCEFLQEEVEMLHNLGGDAMKWNMLGMFKAKKDAGIRAGDRVYPGKIWMLDDLKDLDQMTFSFDMSPALVKENSAMRYADMATGANQAMSGQADQTLKSGGGAMAQQVLMESSSTILDAEFETLDEYVGEMGKFLAILVTKNSAFVPLDTLVSAEDAMLLKGFFSAYTSADIVTQFRFTVKTTDIQRSESTKKETLALFSQLYSGYISEVLNLMAQRMQLVAAMGGGMSGMQGPGAPVGAQGSGGIQGQSAMQGSFSPQGAQAPLAGPPQAAQLIAFLDRAISGKTDLMRQIADYMHVGIDLDKYFVTEVFDDGTGLESDGGTQGSMGPVGAGGDLAGAGLPAGSDQSFGGAAGGLLGA